MSNTNVFLYLCIFASVFVFCNAVGADKFVFKFKKTKALLDYEGDLMDGKFATDKRAWTWVLGGIDNYRGLHNLNWYNNCYRLMPMSESCKNGTKLKVICQGWDKPYSVWTTNLKGESDKDGYIIRSGCGAGYRLRAVGSVVLLIDDDHDTDDDIFDIETPVFAPEAAF